MQLKINFIIIMIVILIVLLIGLSSIKFSVKKLAINEINFYTPKLDLYISIYFMLFSIIPIRIIKLNKAKIIEIISKQIQNKRIQENTDNNYENKTSSNGNKLIYKIKDKIKTTEFRKYIVSKLKIKHLKLNFDFGIDNASSTALITTIVKSISYILISFFNVRNSIINISPIYNQEIYINLNLKFDVTLSIFSILRSII